MKSHIALLLLLALLVFPQSGFAVIESHAVHAGNAAQASDWIAVRKLVDAQYMPHIKRFPWAGISVGIIRGGEVRFYNYGNSDGSKQPATSESIYAINSLTKPFTGLLLAQLVLEREVALDEPVQDFIHGHALPTNGGKPITFLDLATHTSGLPRVPGNLVHPDTMDSYNGYTDKMFFHFLSRYNLPSTPAIGTHYSYSNLGYGLLGYALTQADEQSFDAMIEDRITGPLHLQDTASATTFNGDAKARMAVGHDPDGKPLPPRHGPQILFGSYAEYSTTRDMVTFLQAFLHPSHDEMGKAIALAQKPERMGASKEWMTALGWEIHVPSNTWFKNGAGGGFNSVMFFNPARKTGLVVLSNCDFKNNETIEPQASIIFNALRN